MRCYGLSVASPDGDSNPLFCGRQLALPAIDVWASCSAVASLPRCSLEIELSVAQFHDACPKDVRSTADVALFPGHLQTDSWPHFLQPILFLDPKRGENLKSMSVYPKERR